MQRGRSFASNGSSLESSHRANRVSIRSSISSTSASDFAGNEDDDDGCAIFSLFLRFVSSPTNSNSSLCPARVNKYELGNYAACAPRLLWLLVRAGLSTTKCFLHPDIFYMHRHILWNDNIVLPSLSDLGVAPVFLQLNFLVRCWCRSTGAMLIVLHLCFYLMSRKNLVQNGRNSVQKFFGSWISELQIQKFINNRSESLDTFLQKNYSGIRES